MRQEQKMGNFWINERLMWLDQSKKYLSNAFICQTFLYDIISIWYESKWQGIVVDAPVLWLDSWPWGKEPDHELTSLHLSDYCWWILSVSVCVSCVHRCINGHVVDGFGIWAKSRTSCHHGYPALTLRARPSLMDYPCLSVLSSPVSLSVKSSWRR